MEVWQAALYNYSEGGGIYEHLDFAVCSVAGSVDRWIHCFSRSRRANPFVAGVCGDFPGFALRTGSKNGLSGISSGERLAEASENALLGCRC
jgi:hypothetical protein